MPTDHASVAATAVVTGEGRGAPLLLTEALSFWGGYDCAQGRIVEAGHPQYGVSLAARVLLMERAKGSSSSSSVLAVAIRRGTGPAAIVMRERDLIVGLGCIVASELYDLHVPMVVVSEPSWRALVAHCVALDGNLVIVANRPGDCRIHSCA